MTTCGGVVTSSRVSSLHLWTSVLRAAASTRGRDRPHAPDAGSRLPLLYDLCARVFRQRTLFTEWTEAVVSRV